MFSVAIALGGDESLKHYAPMAVSPALRGYAREESQLRLPGGEQPKFAVSITALAARWCPTGRDLYLQKHSEANPLSWERSVIGKVVDGMLVQLYQDGLDVVETFFEDSVASGVAADLEQLRSSILERGQGIASTALDEWTFPGTPKRSLEAFAEEMAPGKGEALAEGTRIALLKLVEYETNLLVDYASSRRSASADWMAEIRATLGRLQTGVKLDSKDFPASVFGVSQGVRPDFVYAVTLVGDLKTGTYHEFYDTVATSYAIFAEYALSRRINTAAILAVDFDTTAGSVRSHVVRVIHPNDELRTRWVTQRDSALKTFELKQEPPHPTDTSSCSVCPFRTICWTGGTVGGTAIRDGKPVVGSVAAAASDQA